MRPCSSSSLARGLGSRISSVSSPSVSSRGAAIEYSAHGRARCFATSSPLSQASGTPTSASKQEALTVLYKATKLLPRVLEATGNSGFARAVEAVAAWEKVLSDVHEDLSAKTERAVRVAVFAVDEWSGATDLVTALLADPLSSDVPQNEALKRRWDGAGHEALNISYGNLNTGTSSVQYPSNFLTQFPIPVEIKEYNSPKSSSSKIASSLHQILQNPALLEADIPIIICNALTTPLLNILNAETPPSAIVLLTTATSQSVLDAIIQKHTPSGVKPPQIIAIDPQRAVHAIETLQAEPTSLSAIQKYQTDFVGSNVSKVTQAVRARLSLTSLERCTIRAKLAVQRIPDVLEWAQTSVRATRRETEQTLVDASRLRDDIAEARSTFERDLFARYEHATDKMVYDEVEQAIAQTKKEMEVFMNRMTWWRMISRVDELSTSIGAAVAQTWCRGLESKLVLQTGRLAALQDRMTQSSFTLLTEHPTISTAVLRNSLLQLKTSPRYRLAVNSLTEPLFRRRNQIIEYPTMRLHVTGQRAVLGMTGGVVSGVGISWAGWLGWLLGSGEGLLGFLGMDTGTAVGAGMLTALLAIRWGVGRWEKGKKRWWQDWVRVTDGLDRDLKVRVSELVPSRERLLMEERRRKATLQDTMARQVVVVAETGAQEMSKLADAREEALEKAEEDIRTVQAGLNDIKQQCELKA